MATLDTIRSEMIAAGTWTPVAEHWWTVLFLALETIEAEILPARRWPGPQAAEKTDRAPKDPAETGE